MTFYEERNVNKRPEYQQRMNVVSNTRQSTLASQGLIMLHRNNNYSNTMRRCVYICKRDKIHWM